MPKTRVAVTIDRQVMARLDELVEEAVFPSRSEAVEMAVREKLDRFDRSRLARECAKLDPAAEKAMAEEGVADALDGWPGY